MPASSLDELPAQLIELRELITQGHALIKDLTRLLREARAARDDLPKAVTEAATEKIGEAVDAGLAEYKAALGTAIDDATATVFRRFDTLAAICLGEDPKSVRTGVTSVPDLLRDYIAAKGLPYRLVHVPPAIAKPGHQGEPS
jgi:hypothetical protein